MIETKNAVITGVSLGMERGILTSYVFLDYGNSAQGFGGYVLHSVNRKGFNSTPGNYAGHFITRVLDIVDVESWDQLKGKTVRVQSESSKIHAIGNIIKDNWFNPSEDFIQIENSFKLD